jgi:hypothetical protein
LCHQISSLAGPNWKNRATGPDDAGFSLSTQGIVVKYRTIGLEGQGVEFVVK